MPGTVLEMIPAGCALYGYEAPYPVLMPPAQLRVYEVRATGAAAKERQRIALNSEERALGL